MGEEVIEKVVVKKHFFFLGLAADFGSISLWGATGSNNPQNKGKTSKFTSTGSGSGQDNPMSLFIPSSAIAPSSSSPHPTIRYTPAAWEKENRKERSYSNTDIAQKFHHFSE